VRDQGFSHMGRNILYVTTFLLAVIVFMNGMIWLYFLVSLCYYTLFVRYPHEASYLDLVILFVYSLDSKTFPGLQLPTIIEFPVAVIFRSMNS
jgi:hypothetical protein